MLALAKLFPKLAWHETRLLRVMGVMYGVPQGEYALLEYYCGEPGCDCRRLLLKVWCESSPKSSLASISFGWESQKFYQRCWCKDEDLPEPAPGIRLEWPGEQLKLSEALLALVKRAFELDPNYSERLKRHYEMCKKKLAEPMKGTSLKKRHKRSRDQRR